MNVPALRFKDDGQEFPEWEEKTLGDVAEIKRGAPSQHLNYVSESIYGIRLLRINDFLRNEPVYVEDTDNIKKFRVQTNDLLIAGTGATAGIVFRVPNEFNNMSFSYNAPRIRITKAYHGFIYFYLISDVILRQQRGLFVGNAQPFLDTNAMRGFVINVPSLPEQTKIANFLTAVDDKITLLTKKADLLSQYKKGVMQQIFSQELRFKDDDGQEFPEWEISSLEKVSINYYQGINTAADKTEYIDGGVPIIQAKHITGEYLDFSDARGMNQFDYEKYKEKYNPKINDLLISNIGTLGKIVLVESKINFLIAWNIFKVTLDSQKCYPRYIREYLKKIAFDGYFDSIKTGNATKFINKTDMLAIQIILPSLPEQTKIANFLTAIDEKITNNQTQLDAVKQYKQGLLQQMFV